MTGRWRGAVVVTTLHVLVGLHLMASPSADAADPVRVLVIGDSIAQGSSGDWTWRYRLWQHLQATSARPVDFVGPRTDVWDYVAQQPGSDEYVDPAFDKDHAARWGMTLAYADTPIDDLVENYQPDIVVEMLGTNDLLFLQQSPEAIETNIRNFVTSARSADPGVHVVLSQITQTWFAGAPELNELLAEGAAELDSADSRVLLADTDAGYTHEAHTFDNGHPNAQGELLIASGVADQLAALGVGTVPARPLPILPLGPRIAPVLSGTGTLGGAHLEWVRSPGAQESEVWQRDVTAGGAWERLAQHVTGLHFEVTDLPVWHLVQFQTRPLKGTQIAQPDAWSNVTEVEVLDDHLDPASAPAMPANIGRGVTASWTAVAHATSYLLQWRRAGTADTWSGMTVAGTSTSVPGLSPKTTYVFRVRAARGGVTGPFSSEATVWVPRRSDVPANVMLVGDSSTQGSTGDWTWRYRLWQHLQATAPGQVDLVGPHDDLWDQAQRTYGHQDYADPAFDRDHAARWGLSVAFPERPIGQVVTGYDVDVVVEMLGIDDLVFLGHTPEHVRSDLELFIADSRAANPGVAVVLGELTQTWLPGAVELNALLHELAVEQDDVGSRVVVAEMADGFVRRHDTYDRSHPGARGELRIAAAVGDALAAIGIGAPPARPLPEVEVGPRIPVELSGRVRNGKIRLRWSGSPGADGYRVVVRQPGRGGSWRPLAEATKRHLVVRGLAGGQRFRFGVLPRKGWDLAAMDVLSNRVVVRVPTP